MKKFEGNAKKETKYNGTIDTRLHVEANDIVSAKFVMDKTAKKQGYKVEDIYEVEAFTYDINSPSVVKIEEKSEVVIKGAEVVEQIFVEEVGVVDVDGGEIVDVEVAE